MIWSTTEYNHTQLLTTTIHSVENFHVVYSVDCTQVDGPPCICVRISMCTRPTSVYTIPALTREDLHGIISINITHVFTKSIIVEYFTKPLTRIQSGKA